ncbi:M20 family metallopeptidase [Barrientosiimonas marina]|uniref:Peptidase M20 domain-containing protein 2 n=1 Tax=Lentibacillus kimchii TaxID=1542911 RepID=A0ABW2UVR9_9BACI
MGLLNEFNAIQDDLVRISEQLYHHPELGNAEFNSMQLLVDYLEKHDFAVETGLVDVPTSFRAEFASDKPGPTIAYLAEYDALPDIGHGCGHNLIAATSIGAGIVLSKMLEETGGKVVIFGTPAEETDGAKVPMAEQGIFADVDLAMMAHPGGVAEESGPTLALDAIQFAFTGKSSHAAAAPEEGVNALDSVIQLFNGINALREHVPADVRMHGIIPQGGKAANVVPDYAVAQFYFRAETRSTLNNVVEKVKGIADGAASMTGATVAISNYELSNDNLVTNKRLSDQFLKHLKDISDEAIEPAGEASGSSDVGNVSQVVPAIHPHIGMNDASLVPHTRRFADTTVTEDGQGFIRKGVLSLAGTGYDVLTDSSLLASIQTEFNQTKK